MDKKFWFKLDKDKIKLQLKDLGRKFSRRKNGYRTLTIFVLFFMLIGVGLAIYNNDKNTELIEPDISFEPFYQENDQVEDRPSFNNLNQQKEDFSLDYGGIVSEERVEEEEKKTSGEEPVEGVVTKPTKPMEQPARTAFTLLKPVSGQILQEPGWYYHPVFNDWRYQYGIEMSGNPGDVVMAAASGRVTTVKEDEYKGILVTVEHDNGWLTTYGHLQKSTVSPGQKISKGQEVGRVGTTGVSAEPSLYFSLKNEESEIDPREYFE